MSKDTFENPFNQAYEAFKTKANQYQQQAINNKAKAIYQDKPYSLEYLGIYRASKLLKIASNLVSVSTCLIAFYLAFSGLMNPYLATIVAVCIAALMEYIKNGSWKLASKHQMKYRKLSKYLLAAIIGLHLFSISASVYGAYRIPELIPHDKEQASTPIDLDSINQAHLQQIAVIDQQIKGLSPKTESSTIRRTIKDLTNQKNTILEAQKTALEHAKSENSISSKKLEEMLTEAEKERKYKLKVIRYSSVGATLLCELLYILCSIFIFNYLFRAYVDSIEQPTKEKEMPTEGQNINLGGNTTTDNNEEGESETPAHQITNEGKRPIGFHKSKEGEKNPPESSVQFQPLKYTRICAFDECKKPFIHKVHNQSYCQNKCRIQAWEKRTGKTLKKKKSKSK